ncbi:MAG: hypothetical protein LBV43_01200 [Prevotella sp.]|jgi:DNA mismatch repair ATPase MutS|nr:hypothetical protein [Prevotella sp.]
MKQKIFEVDKQTKTDLEIFGNSQEGNSVFGLFNHTRHVKGRQKLYDYLNKPLTDLDEITDRKEAIEYFMNYIPSGIDLDKNSLDFAEYYFKQANFPTRKPSKFVAFERFIMDRLRPGNDYYLVEKGVSSTVDMLKSVYQFCIMLDQKIKSTEKKPRLLQANTRKLLALLSQSEYVEIINNSRIRPYDRARFDYMFRYTHKQDILYILNIVYEYDVFYAVAKAAVKFKLSFPDILPQDETCLITEGLFHPFVKDVVANDLRFEGSSNLLFITGPNMAGKSTFLKSLGLAVYLAHAGFPVPASYMKLSLLAGLCTTINISDNLSSGYSHYYAEVMRIKNVAEKLKENPNMLVIFDELFRGTNVKDAYDGTLAVVSAFAKLKSAFFVISTHIVEVTKGLDANDNIQFSYFEIIEKNGHPEYTYKLRQGVSDVRLGMYIINKEGLIELINNISNTK